MTDEKPDKKKPEPRRPGGKQKRIAIRTALVLLALLMLLLLLPVCGCAQTITGKVVGVSDGDTITVLDDQKRQHKIRLEGIDAPESNQDYGSRAKQSLSDLVFGRVVMVISSKKDKYGRTLGRVKLDGKDINQEQIDRGMAWFYRAYRAELPANVAAVYELREARAQQEKRGRSKRSAGAAREARAVGRSVADSSVGFQTRQPDGESAGRETDDDGNRADHRQPQQQDLPHVQLSRLQQDFRAQPRAVQD